MPEYTWNLEWLNHNSQRSYPLTEDATEVDVSGTVTLPKGFILMLEIPVHAGLSVDTTKFFIRSIAIFSSGLSLSVGYDDGSSSPPVVATTVVSLTNHSEGDHYALIGKTDFIDTIGQIAFGPAAVIQELPAGEFFFDPAGGKLEPHTIRPIIRGVSSITAVNGTERSDRLYGDIELVAGRNIRITPIIISGSDPQIRIDAIEGEGLVEDCVCEGDEEGPCIRTINGVPPTPAGDFFMVGNDCLDINEITNGLQLTDVCSEPCCGCEELEALVDELRGLNSGARTVENFVVRLETEVTQMNSVVLGSRLNDEGCLEC